MSLIRNQKGKWAEEQAKLFLESQGYQILYQRYKTREGEIDLIISQPETLIAVEVKYRRLYREAAECISLKQQKRIISTFNHFLAHHEELYNKCPFLRIDVVLLCQTQPPIHIINAWQYYDFFEK